MGNIQSNYSTLDKEAKQAINETKEKETQFHEELCQEALIWVNLLTIVRNKVKEKVQQNNKGRESWKINETTQFEEFCMICQVPIQILSAAGEVQSLPKCASCYKRVCDDCCTTLSFNKSYATLCYPCVWRRKISQITGEWFDDSLIKRLHKKTLNVQDGDISLMPCCQVLTNAEKIFLSKIVFPQGAIELIINQDISSNILKVDLVAAYNLPCSSNTAINPVAKLALLISDNNEHPIIKRSETLYDTCNPVWSTEFEFKINDKIMTEQNLVIIVANNLGNNRKKFLAEIIISLSDKHYLNNIPHLLKLSDQTLVDSKLKRSPDSVSSSQEDINMSPSINKTTSPEFVTDGLLQHSLHQSARASSCDSLTESTFADTDSSFDSASSDESMSCDELLSTSGSSTTGRVGSIAIRSKKRRKDSREQRKSLMQHMHKARCNKEKLYAGIQRSVSEEAISAIVEDSLPVSAEHRCSSVENINSSRKKSMFKHQKLCSSVWIQQNSNNSESCGIVELSLLYTENDGRLIVTFHSARELPQKVDKSSSYLFRISLKGKKTIQSHTTPYDMTTPQFGQRYLFTAVNKLNHILKVKVYYKRAKLLRRSKLGEVIIPLKDVPGTDLENDLKKEYSLIYVGNK